MIKDSNRAVIGPQTLISLPRFGVKNIPAKVDTGADSSSIWASGINEVDGKLTFALFGPSSKFYTGEKISTRDYEVISVKNSFGVTQYRYRVRLAVTIEKTNLKVKFTLADRSRSTMPVLVGRRTLMGRFVVDVASAPQKKFEILVLNTKYAKSEDTEVFLKKVKKQLDVKASFTPSTYRNIKFTIDRSCNAELIKQKKSLSKFGLVYFKTAVKERDIASCVAQYLSGQGVRYINRAVLQNFSDNKLLQYIMMTNSKIRVPKTIYINRALIGGHYSEIKSKLGIPFVLKDIEGKKGRNNFLINKEADFKKAIKIAESNELEMIAQQYIPNDGDYRVLVFGKQIPLIIHRRAKTGHVNNTSSGAIARIVEKGEVPGKAQRMAIEAASIMNLDIAGVDLVKDNSSGNWYCLEVNRGPQLATGAFKQEKVKIFANYIKKQQEKMIL